MPPSTDAERLVLLQCARQGHGAALGKLLEAYRDYMTLLARVQIGRRLQGKADASDLVQEAFLQAHQNFPKFRGQTEAELLGWLRQILAAQLAGLLRRYLGTRRRDVRLERELAEELEQSSQALDRGLVARGSSPSHEAVRRENAVLLAEALARLPDEQREVLILRHLEHRSFPEVARRMGRSLDRVKKLWPRALERLRRSLGASP